MSAMKQARTPVVELRRVSFSYGRVPILRAVDVAVQPGEFVAVIGGNGSGKTTLMRLALGLLKPDAGEVLLFGQPLPRFEQWQRVGYVPQRAAIDATIPVSVEEVVRTGAAALQPAGAWLRARRNADRDARVRDVLALMELEPLRRTPVSRLSGGQQQRVLIARALVTSPELLVLDEPTTGIDADARGVLRSALHRLVRQEGVSVVYVSHDPEGFAGLADRVVEVQGGDVAPCDDPSAHGHRHTPAAQGPHP